MLLRSSRVIATSKPAVATPTLTNPSLTAAICSLEHKAWAAHCSSGADLLPLLSSNPIWILPGDLVLTSVSDPPLHAMLEDAFFTVWKSYKLSHDEVVILGKDSALIYYRIEVTKHNRTYRAICSSVWVLEGPTDGATGGWKMAHHQQTPF